MGLYFINNSYLQSSFQLGHISFWPGPKLLVTTCREESLLTQPNGSPEAFSSQFSWKQTKDCYSSAQILQWLPLSLRVKPYKGLQGPYLSFLKPAAH